MKHVIFALVLFVTSLSVFAQRHPGHHGGGFGNGHYRPGPGPGHYNPGHGPIIVYRPHPTHIRLSLFLKLLVVDDNCVHRIYLLVQ